MKSAAAAPVSVLVIEPNDQDMDILSDALTFWGYSWVRAVGAAEALWAVAAIRPQVVLTDLVLPDGDGCELASQLRQRLRNPPIFAAVTGWGDSLDFARTSAAGFARHFVKPLPLSELRVWLADCLARTPAGGGESPLADLGIVAAAAATESLAEAVAPLTEGEAAITDG